jgi:DNA-directed RNA polymerase subunit RPC12/RpoP
MNDDVECPYCGEGQEINHDDGYGYEEDRTHQQECGDCGKTYVYTTSISFYHDAEKADCLNGGEHTFEKVCMFPSVIRGKVIVRCSQCGEEEKIDYKDAHLYGYDQDRVDKSAKKWEEDYPE